MSENFNGTKEMIDFIENAEKEGALIVERAKTSALQEESRARDSLKELMDKAQKEAEELRQKSIKNAEEAAALKGLEYKREGEKKAKEITDFACKNMDKAIEYCCRKVVD